MSTVWGPVRYRAFPTSVFCVLHIVVHAIFKRWLYIDYYSVRLTIFSLLQGVFTSLLSYIDPMGR